jgi:hypothetical protein
MWVARAPAGTHFTRGRLLARGREADGYQPHLLVGAIGHNVLEPFATPHRAFDTFGWRANGGADRVVARLACTRHRADCGTTDSPKVYIKRARFHLFDTAAPALTGIGGALLGAPVQRGTQGLTVNARDPGSGVRRILVRVNGTPFEFAGLNCKVDGGRQLALSLSPCPNTGGDTFSIDTRLPAFHEGQNAITACADDYADASPHERCAQRRIRVDNDCPISDVKLQAAVRFTFGDGNTVKRVRFGQRPRVVGSLVEPLGAPVPGALVCVSERPALTNSTEKLVGAPLRTAQLGGIGARLPAGPSRIVYLTYWRGAEQVATRALHLLVRPKVDLRARPRGRLHNGQTMRLRARLRGPYHAHRKVRLLARPPGGHWVPFSINFVRQTNDRGVVRASHTFHHVSGTHTFRFKVTVPSQRGYPYLPGSSRVVKKTVTGGS